MTQVTLKRRDARLDALIEKDPKLQHLFDHVGDLTIEISWDMFPFLVYTIIGQQLSVKVVQTLYARLLSACQNTLNPERLLGLSKDTLRSLGLSMRKAEYLHALALAADSGMLEKDTLDTFEKPELFAHFQEIRGIGPWSVDMVLMFVFDDMDHFSKKDLGLIHGYNRFFNRDMHPDDIEKDAMNWRPYRSIVAHYLWHVHDSK